MASDAAEGVKAMAAETEVSVGQVAPDFELPDASGRKVKLSDFRGKKTVVLYFYPKDETSVCTAQACSFRDNYEEFKSAGAEVIGVSADSEESHGNFATHHKLPYVLLADQGGKVRKQYGVKGALGLTSGRVTYVIDREGVVRLSFSAQFRAKPHVEKALALVQSLEKAPVA